MTLERNRLTLAALVLGGVVTASSGPAFAQVTNAETVTLAVETELASAIIAELERAENLLCPRCVGPVTGLLADERFEVRTVAAWWLAKRPQRRQIGANALAAAAGGDAIAVRNAADVLGAFGDPSAVAVLSGAVGRAALTVEARVHAARALGAIGHPDANPALTSAMQAGSPELRLQALYSWLEIRGQTDAQPLLALLTDAEPAVRRKAAAAIGSLRDPLGRTALQTALSGDEDPAVRRNAAWSLGQIGDGQARGALEAATGDASGLVRMTARAALRLLR